jgi:hypothetical protein
MRGTFADQCRPSIRPINSRGGGAFLAKRGAILLELGDVPLNVPVPARERCQV